MDPEDDQAAADAAQTNGDDHSGDNGGATPTGAPTQIAPGLWAGDFQNGSGLLAVRMDLSGGAVSGAPLSGGALGASAASNKPPGVPGFPHEWDPIVEPDVAAFNQKNDAQPGDDVYLDPDWIKAMIMIEAAHNPRAYQTDPMQVNNLGDWDGYKADLGLTKGQAPGPELGIRAGIDWLESKSYPYNSHGIPGPFLGYKTVINRYNGGGPNYYSDVLKDFNAIKNYGSK